MCSTTDYQFEERSKLWNDVKVVVESEENVENAMKMKRNFAYEFYKSVQCKSINIEEDIQRHQGGPMNFQGEPMNVQGEPMKVQDIHENSEVQYLLVFPDGQTIEVEHNILTEALYKPHKLLNYPLYKDREWLRNIMELRSNHSVFSHLNDHIEILETCTRTLDIRKKPLHYVNKSLLISTIDYLTAFMNDLVQAVNKQNLAQFSYLISSKAILINEIDEAYQIPQDAALKILGLDRYGFSTKLNQTDLPTVYTEGRVHFKTLSNSMDIHTPLHKFTSFVRSKTYIEEQLTNPFILFSLVNVHLIENASSSTLPNKIKESHMSNKKIEEVFYDKSNYLDNEWKDSMKIRNNNNFIILACRTIETNNLDMYLNDVIANELHDVDILSSNTCKANTSYRTHLSSISLTPRTLRGNILKRLAPFEHLRCVVLSDINLRSEKCQYLSLNTTIRELDLSKNYIGPEGCQHLSLNTTIRVLNLERNNIRSEGCQYLSSNTTIQVLNLSKNHIGDEGFQYLSLNTSLRELIMSWNAIEPEGCQHLIHNTSLRELNLSWNNVGPAGCQYISFNTSIRKLNLTRNRIGLEGCQYLSLTTSIRELSLSHNDMRNEECQYFSHNTSLRELDLSWNNIGPAGCQYISFNTSIRKLNLTSNNIGLEGCQYLTLNTSIRELSLARNYVGPEGSQCLSQWTSLSTLNLSYSNIGNEGFRYLSLNTSLRELDISWNYVGPEGCRYLTLNTSIRELKILGNTIGPEDVEHFNSRRVNRKQ